MHPKNPCQRLALDVAHLFQQWMEVQPCPRQRRRLCSHSLPFVRFQDLVSCVENTRGRLVAHETFFGDSVVFQSTVFAKVVSAACDHRISQRRPEIFPLSSTLQARKRKWVFFFLQIFFFALLGQFFLSSHLLFPIAVKLPSQFVISSIVQEFARISVSAVSRFFVIFAYVWLVIDEYGSSHVVWRTLRTILVGCFGGVFAAKAGTVIFVLRHSMVQAISFYVCICLRFCCVLGSCVDRHHVRYRAFLSFLGTDRRVFAFDGRFLRTHSPPSFGEGFHRLFLVFSSFLFQRSARLSKRTASRRGAEHRAKWCSSTSSVGPKEWQGSGGGIRVLRRGATHVEFGRSTCSMCSSHGTKRTTQESTASTEMARMRTWGWNVGCERVGEWWNLITSPSTFRRFGGLAFHSSRFQDSSWVLHLHEGAPTTTSCRLPCAIRRAIQPRPSIHREKTPGSARMGTVLPPLWVWIGN